MTQEQYKTIQKYENTINDAVFESTIEVLLDWFAETNPSKFSKEDIIKDALKGFKEFRDEAKKTFGLDLDKI